MYFFKTLREKEFVLRELKRGRPVPFIKYLAYRFRISHLFTLQRKNYAMPVWYAPLAFWLWTRTDKVKDDETFIEHFVQEGDIVVDCGAHLGTLTMTAAKCVGKTGRVVACEMHPRTYAYLQKNIKKNNLPNVKTLHTAIGHAKGTVLVTDDYVSDLNHVTSTGTISVAMHTLDEITKDLSKIDLLKLDIEGYELHALQGGVETLKKTKAIYFESAEGSFARYNYTLEDIVLFLRNEGFACYMINNDMNYVPLPDGHITKTRYENILALRK